MKSPLEIIRDWFDALPEKVSGNLGYFCVIRLTANYSTDQDGTEAYREWLGTPLDSFRHIGRAVFACALIDYIMEEQGDPRHWEKSLDFQLNMLESDLTPDTKQTANRMLPKHPQIREAWLEAATKWRQLRSSTLSYDALRTWEDYMLLGVFSGFMESSKEPPEA